MSTHTCLSKVEILLHEKIQQMAARSTDRLLSGKETTVLGLIMGTVLVSRYCFPSSARLKQINKIIYQEVQNFPGI